MNVTDVQETEKTGDRLALIFERQRELLEKYGPIERRNGNSYKTHCTDLPVDPSNRFAQSLIKDFAWRVTEALAEAAQALEEDHQNTFLLHAQEEVADAFHFLVELCHIVGLTAEDVAVEGDGAGPGEDLMNVLWRQMGGIYMEQLQQVKRDWETERSFGYHQFRIAAFAVISEMGKAMNCLKNKPWKQTHILTDARRFKGHLKVAFRYFPLVAVMVGLDEVGLFQMYFRKSEVNKFRQQSNY
jgi:hypothetical protein